MELELPYLACLPRNEFKFNLRMAPATPEYNAGLYLQRQAIMSKLLTMTSTALAILLTAAAGTQPAKTSLLPDAQLTAITSEASGALAKDTIIALGRLHRVHASPGFHQ